MKLLSIDSNSKLAKTNKATSKYLFAGLSLYPDNVICPASKIAGCFNDCLKSAGRGRFSNVIKARQSKSNWWHSDRDGFLDQLRKDLHAFQRKADKAGKQPVVRLNVISDIAWEDYGIPQSFPAIRFYDYSKRSDRFIQVLPDNYYLTFSYSGADRYQKHVKQALDHGANIAVVFSGGLPSRFMNRKVIDGDLHDIRIDDPKGIVIGLKAKGSAKQSESDFVIRNPELIGAH